MAACSCSASAGAATGMSTATSGPSTGPAANAEAPVAQASAQEAKVRVDRRIVLLSPERLLDQGLLDQVVPMGRPVERSTDGPVNLAAGAAARGAATR